MVSSDDAPSPLSWLMAAICRSKDSGFEVMRIEIGPVALKSIVKELGLEMQSPMSVCGYIAGVPYMVLPDFLGVRLISTSVKEMRHE